MVRLVHLTAGLLAWVLSASAGPAFTNKLAELQQQLAAQPANPALLFALGDLCHDEGVKDNAKAVLLAEKYFRQLLRQDTNHARGLALLGSTLTMKARDTFWPGTRLSLVKEGNKLMDAAVKMAPDDPQVRMTRALNNVNMPKFLNRETLARDDLAWLWEKVRTSPEIFDEQSRQEIALAYGVALNKFKSGKTALEVWNQGLAINPRSPTASLIQQHLAKVEKP